MKPTVEGGVVCDVGVWYSTLTIKLTTMLLFLEIGFFFPLSLSLSMMANNGQ